jgi:MFS family permease
MSQTYSQHRLSHRQVLVAFSGLLLGMLLGALDQTIVATALPTIVGELGGTPADLIAQRGITHVHA